MAVGIDPVDGDVYISVDDNQPATARDMEEGDWNACRFVLVEYSPIFPLQKNDRVTDEAGNLGTVLAVREESGMVDVLFDKFGSDPRNAIRMPVGKVTRVVNAVPEKETLNTNGASPIKSDGGSSDYYKVTVDLPQPLYDKRGNLVKSIMFETQDLLYAMFYGEWSCCNVGKAARRIAESLQGRGKEGTSISYDAKKIIWFGEDIMKRFGNND